MTIRHVPVADEAADWSDERILATDVEFAASLGAQMKGLMFRDEVPEGYALVFRFDDPPRWMPGVFSNRRSVHMLFVKVPLDVLWIRDGRVERVSTLSPWTGFGLGRADTIVEMAGGAADGVDVGDAIRIGDED